MSQEVSYEKIKYSDPNFPVTFHQDSLTDKRNTGFYLHWHEHLEIIYITKGRGTIIINNNQYEAQKGDTIIINSNSLHSMPTKPVDCTYHCLILDKRFCDRSLVPISEMEFNSHFCDKRVSNIFLLIEKEMKEKKFFYKASVQATTIELLVLLAREYATMTQKTDVKKGDNKQMLIKESINYISSRYYSELSIDEIAKQVGISRYYFCRAFKETTGQTAFDFINLLRCSNAQRLLQTGRYNISESAFESGFNNLSYFARAYKKHIGVLPSEDLARMAEGTK